jgi:hypothetical protein
VPSNITLLIERTVSAAPGNSDASGNIDPGSPFVETRRKCQASDIS